MGTFLLASLAALVVTAATASTGVPPELEKLSRAYLDSKSPSDRDRLLGYAKKDRASRERGLAAFALGVGDYRARNFSGAIAHLQAAAELVPELADYARYHHALSLSANGDYRGAAEIAGRFAIKFPSSPMKPSVVRLELESLLRAGDVQDVLKRLSAPENGLSPPASALLKAKAAQANKDLPGALQYYREVYYRYPLSPEADLAENAISAIRRASPGRVPAASADHRVLRAETLFSAGRYRDARAEYLRAATVAKGPTLALARVRVAACDYHLNRSADAHRALVQIKPPTAEIRAERLYHLAQCARRLGRVHDFRQRVDKLLQEHPQSPWCEKALFSAGNFHWVKHESGDARRHFGILVRRFPKGSHSSEAHWKLAWLAYLERDTAKAKSLFAEHLRLFPTSSYAPACLYWLGRLAEQSREPLSARTHYARLLESFPNHFHSRLARERLTSQPAGVNTRREPPASVVSGPAIRPSPDTERRIARARLLRGLGLVELSRNELQAASSQAPDSYWIGLELAEDAAARSQTHQAIRFLKAYAPDYLSRSAEEFPRRFWELMFPIEWESDLHSHASRRQLDPFLVAALIRQESEFNPSARSRAGAMGLMQIMPATGGELARKSGLGKLPDSLLFKPEVNLRLGAYYLRSLLDRFDQRTEVALAAYNAGASRAAAWTHARQHAERDEFVESIPFSETRNYVQTVLRDHQIYRSLYTEPANASLSRTPHAILRLCEATAKSD